MKAIGIIAEYNPFHNGHLYQLEETRRLGQADCMVAVMSGDFTQRGEIAMADKWTRAEMAVRNGVDLVIELPFAFACNNAEYFAKGAIRILEGLGGIDCFSFGSESGDLDALLETARALAYEDEAFQRELKKFLDRGDSYPRARYEALKEWKGQRVASLIKDPNNILGIEYLKEWLKINSQMKPMTVKRMGPGYHDLTGTGNFASASGIRKILNGTMETTAIQHWVPEATKKVLDESKLERSLSEKDLFPLLVYRIISSSTEQLGEILASGEGLEHKLKRALPKSSNMNELKRAVKSKRYTDTRINRLLIQTLIGLHKKQFFQILDDEILYARVLALSKRGGEYLRYVKKNELNRIPILTHIRKEINEDDPIFELLTYDILASDIYNFLMHGETYSHSDYVKKPFVKI